MLSETVYRLEHVVSGYGPYELRGKNKYQSSIVKYLPEHFDPERFNEYIDWCSVRCFNIAQLPDNWRFGWSSRELIDAFILKINFKRYKHFIVKQYTVSDYLLLPDGQIIFDINS